MGIRGQLALLAILVAFASHILPSQTEELRIVTPSDLKKCILQQIERKDQLIAQLIDDMLKMLNDTKELIRSERQSFKCSETEYVGGHSTPQKFRVLLNDKNYHNNALAMYFMSRMSREDVFDYDIPMLPMRSSTDSKSQRNSDFETMCAQQRQELHDQLNELQFILEKMQEAMEKIDQCKESLTELKNMKSKN